MSMAYTEAEIHEIAMRARVNPGWLSLGERRALALYVLQLQEKQS